MNDVKRVKITPVRFITSCIICAALGVAPFVLGNFLEWDIMVSVILMVVVAAPVSTAAFAFINRVKND